MKKYVLNYYPKFKCIAGECKHTCCAGWEMCIDAQTLASYKAETAPFASALKKGVNYKKAKFKADKKTGRCAFLNAQGLCEIILTLGENRLCKVCREHPRFRNAIAEEEEIGLDFCCERATELILSQSEKIERIAVENGGEAVPPAQGVNGECAPDFLLERVLAFRGEALSAVQDRERGITERIRSLLAACGARITEKDFDKVLKAFIKLERLDKAWGTRLAALRKRPAVTAVPLSLALPCEQFLANELYRHLSDAEDTLWVRARAVAIILSWWVIQSVWENEREENGQDFTLLCDIVRAFSADVEYSQKNLTKLFGFARAFINL